MKWRKKEEGGDFGEARAGRPSLLGNQDPIHILLKFYIFTKMYLNFLKLQKRTLKIRESP